MALNFIFNVCHDLEDPDTFMILVSHPVVKLVKVEDLEPRDFCGFTAQCRVTITDGSGEELQVVVPEEGIISRFDGSEGDLAESLHVGMVLRVNQALCFPYHDEHVIVIYSGEIVTDD